ncbi:MAG: MFS transporter [Caldilineales bacterium]
MTQQLPQGAPRFQGRDWHVMTPVGLALALSLLGDATLYTVLPTHTAQAGIALASVGIILSVNRAVRLLLNTPVGLAYDRWPRRRIFVPAAAVGVLSTVLCALSPGFWLLLLGRLLWGLAWSGMWVGTQAIALDVAGPGQRGRLMGVANAWYFLGGALSFFIGGYLTDRLGYRETLWAGAAISAVGLLAAFLFLPETRPAGAATRGPLHWRVPRWSSLKPHLGTGGWAALYAQGILRFCLAGVATATLALFVEQSPGTEVSLAGVTVGAATLTGLLLAIRPLLSLVTAPSAGRLSDIHGRWPLLNWGGVLGGVSFLVLMTGGLLALLVNGVLSALSMAILGPVSSGLVGDVSPPAMQGRNLGWLANAGDLGSALGPLVAYALLPVVSLNALYLLCAGLMISILAASLAGRRADASAAQPNC